MPLIVPLSDEWAVTFEGQLQNNRPRSAQVSVGSLTNQGGGTMLPHGIARYCGVSVVHSLNSRSARILKYCTLSVRRRESVKSPVFFE